MILEYAAPLLADGGHVVAWKGAVSPEEAADAGRRRGPRPRPGGRPRVTPYAGARDHTLHAYCKIAPTPARFPRRPGMATKRPLGA